MRDKDFSNIVSERFEDYGSSPSNAVWGNIESNLDQGEKRRLIVIWWYMAAVLALAIITVNIMTVGKNDSQTSSTSPGSKSSHDERIVNKGEKNHSQEENSNSNSEKSNQNSFTANKSLSQDDSHVVNENVTPKNEGSSEKVNNHHSPIKPATSIKEGTTNVASKPSLKQELENVEVLTYLDPYRFPLGGTNDVLLSENDITSYIQILPEPRWRIGARASVFINASNPVNGPGLDENILLSAYNDPSPEPDNYNFISHRRFFETEVFTQVRLKNRFQLSSGISFSNGYDAQRLDTVLYGTNRNTFGVPIGLEYTFFTKNRFQLNGGITTINEYARVKTTVGIPNGNTTTSDPTQSAGIASAVYEEVSSFKGHNYAFGLQGTIGANYRLTPRLKILASIGYRNYLIERYSLNYQYVKNPNYFNGSIGFTWRLK